MNNNAVSVLLFFPSVLLVHFMAWFIQHGAGGGGEGESREPDSSVIFPGNSAERYPWPSPSI